MERDSDTRLVSELAGVARRGAGGLIWASTREMVRGVHAFLQIDVKIDPLVMGLPLPTQRFGGVLRRRFEVLDETGRLLDDGELRLQIREGCKRGRSAEPVRCADGVAQPANRCVIRDGPDAGPHLRRLPRVFLLGEGADASPPHGNIHRLAAIRQMRSQDRGVLNLARTAVDRRHTETDARASLVATLGHATVWRARALEVYEVAPDDEFA